MSDSKGTGTDIDLYAQYSWLGIALDFVIQDSLSRTCQLGVSSGGTEEKHRDSKGVLRHRS